MTGAMYTHDKRDTRTLHKKWDIPLWQNELALKGLKDDHSPFSTFSYK